MNGIFNKCFAANLLENLTLKKIKNRSGINKVTAVSLMSPFLEHGQVSTSSYYSKYSQL